MHNLLSFILQTTCDDDEIKRNDEKNLYFKK